MSGRGWPILLLQRLLPALMVAGYAAILALATRDMLGKCMGRGTRCLDGIENLVLSAWFGGLLPIFAFCAMTHVRLEIDAKMRTLAVSWVRWPLRTRRRTFPLSRVEDVVVKLNHDDEGTPAGYSFELLVEGEEPLSLVGGSQGDYERVAEEIRALLPDAKDPNGA